ncbi:MAG: hypothetical protein WB986_00430 [Methanoregula sp.]|uniref:hypothetical protein n=1 Tax=Methanoregula sp. TaxID=2052170 RepID=UPI003C620E91
MKNSPAFLAVLLCLPAICSLYIPAASAALPGSGGYPGDLVTVAELNATNISLANATFPAEYQVTPTLIFIGISTNDTSLDGPKGEMAAVPRTIGFSASPASLAMAVTIIAVAGISAWYLWKRKQD